jgi:PKD domain
MYFFSDQQPHFCKSSKHKIRDASRAICEAVEPRWMLSVTVSINVVGSAPASSYNVSAGIPFAVNATVNVNGSQQSDTTAISNDYEWDFGDVTAGSAGVPASEFNHLPGFNAAHIYNTPGTYQVKLQVNSSDGTESTAAATVIVGNAPYTITYYVDNNPSLDNVSNTGLDPAHPLSSYATAFSKLGTSSNVRVRFRQGETFPVTVSGNQINSNDVLFDSYWSSDSANYATSHARPVIQAASGFGAHNLLPTWFYDGFVCRDLAFDTAPGITLYAQGILLRGNHAAVIGCEFLHIGDCIKGGDGETQGWGSGILIQDNVTPTVGGQIVCGGASVWADGWDWSLLGNYFAGSTAENTI